MKGVIKCLNSKLSLNTNGKKVLDRFIKGNEIEKHLIICIAIDLKNGLLNNKFVENIFNNININIATPLLEQYDNLLLKNKNFISQIQNNNKEKLVRVMTLETFNSFYFNPYAKINMIFNNVKKVNELKEEIERGNLEKFKMKNNNDVNKINRLVWVTPFSQLNIPNGVDKANFVVKRLGLPIENNSKSKYDREYVYIVYPDNFNETLFQPAHNSCLWSNDEVFFMSYKKDDNYGRTRCHYGDNVSKRMKELIHHSIDNTDYSYSIKYLGQLTDVNKNTINFATESLKRFYE